MKLRLGTSFGGAALPQGRPGLPPCSPGCTTQQGGGKGPCLGCLLLQKREKPRASPAPPWQRANFPASFPSFPPPHPASSLKGAVSRLVAGGKGDSAGKGWGQGLTSNP